LDCVFGELVEEGEAFGGELEVGLDSLDLGGVDLLGVVVVLVHNLNMPVNGTFRFLYSEYPCRLAKFL
jgi:hypothetical protein